MIEAMKLVLAGVTPYGACKRVGVATNTMYRSRLYRMWKEAQPLQFVNKERYNELLFQVRQELDLTRPVRKKKVKIAPTQELR